MPHFKCVMCRTRLHVGDAALEPVGDLCPECGRLLQPVSGAAEVIGYRAIVAADRGGSRLAEPHRRIVSQIDTFIKRRAAHLELERVIDELRRRAVSDPGPASAAGALPMPGRPG